MADWVEIWQAGATIGSRKPEFVKNPLSVKFKVADGAQIFSL